MKKLKIKSILIFSILTLSILFSTSKVDAQTSENYDVTVSPVYFDFSTNPGGIISDKIRIRNNTTKPIPIKVNIKKLTGDINGDLTLRNDNSDNSLSWVQFSNITFIAKPLEWIDVPFKINVPKDAAYGYYYAISMEQDKNSPLAKTGAKITGAAAVPILLNVRKTGAKSEAKILDFSTKDTLNEYLPIDFNVKVENTGNVHVRPHGNIFITADGGKDIAILDVNSGLSNIIPNTNKMFESSWADGFLIKENVLEDGQLKLDKKGNPVKKITVNWNKLTSFRIGRYTANLLLVYDNGTRDATIESTFTFWVIPYTALIVIAISLVIAVLIIRFLLKFYINKELRRRSR